MAKNEKTSAEADREARWALACESMQKANPLAYAARVASGEYDTIPESFQ